MTILRAIPANAVPVRPRARSLSRPQPRAVLLAALASLISLAVVSGARLPAIGAGRPAASTGAPVSLLGNGIVLTVYGRGFGTAPVLGRLGMDRSFDDVARQVAPYVRGIEGATGVRHVRIAIHLIYALAIPCTSPTTCLLYLDDAGVDIVHRYILPAQRRGWLVVLDDQLGRSTPTTEMDRLIAHGYLRYDNVEVAFDPEYRLAPGAANPGEQVGSVDATEVNDAARVMNRAAAAYHLPHRKIMIVHQWSASMIRHRRRLTKGMRWVEPVIVMDGMGAPGQKVHVYNSLLGRRARFATAWRGIKLFPSNPYEQAGHLDTPVLSWPEVMGRAAVQGDDGRAVTLSPAPRLVVMT